MTSGTGARFTRHSAARSPQTQLKLDAERAYSHALSSGMARQAAIFKHAATQAIEHDNPLFFEAIGRMKRVPVTIDEFVDSKEFLAGVEFDIWPTLRGDLRALNPDVLIGEQPITLAMLGGATGCHAKGTPILMWNGRTKAVEDVAVGDWLMGPDSLPRRVLSLARGSEPMYRVTPNRGGEPFDVNQGHILSLRRTSRKKGDARAGEVVNVTVADYLKWGAWDKHLSKLRRVAVEWGCRRQLARPTLSIAPYALGLWLGDGSKDRAGLTNIDPEPIAYWCEYATTLGCTIYVNDDEYIMRGQRQHNPMLNRLRGLGVYRNKHIPHRYLTASREDRLALLAGLIDTDGSTTCGGYEITQKSTRLTDDIQFLARSLGFSVGRAVKFVNGEPYHRLHINGPCDQVPVLIPRKRLPPRTQKKDCLATGFTVEPIGSGDYYGFALSGDHLYLTADFTVHHNTGKSHLATGTTAYQVYLTTCFDVPQRLFGLTPMTTIVFMLQSVSPTITKRVLYDPFRKMFTSMDYVRKWCEWNEKKERVLELGNNVQIIPAAASLQALLGQAIAGAILDETNFMQIVEASKQVPGDQGMGGHFDQAEVVFSNIERRRIRSFTTRGVSIGSILAVSSTRYKNDFLDRKIDEMERVFDEEPAGTPKTFLVFRHKQYEVNPRFASGKYPTFRLLVGTDEYSSRVLEDWETAGTHYPAGGQILNIPMPYKVQFKKDPDAALRDVVGIATDAITPWFRRRHKIAEAMQRGLDSGLKPWTLKDEYELATEGMPEWDEASLPKSPNVRGRRHYIHVDLSKNKDKCGIGIVRHDGFINQPSDQDPSIMEVLPKLTVVAALGLQPSVVHELDIAEVRGFILKLTRLGINVKSITFDNFASHESIQMTRKYGITSDLLSVDRSTEPWEAARDLIYQDRLDIQPDCQLLQVELNTVEYVPTKDKVDHPPRGTKDVADAVVGAIAGALADRTIRNRIEAIDTQGDRVHTPRPGRKQDIVRKKDIVRR